MKIVEAYTKYKGQCIIAVSGFQGSGKTQIAKFISKVCGFKLISLSSYFLSLEEYDKDENYVSLKNDIKILDWENIYESIDWKKFNNVVNDNKKNGIVIVGFGFPNKMIDFQIDYHIHIKIRKQDLMMKREEYFQNNKDKNKHELLNDDVKYLLNNVTYPHYIKLTQDTIVNMNITMDDIEKAYDNVFNFLMTSISTWLKDYDDNKKDIGNIGSNNKNKHMDGNSDAYDDYYHTKHKYDFDDVGDDKTGKQSESESNESSDSDVDDFIDTGDIGKKRKKTKKINSSSESSNNSEAKYLYTSQ
jgi:hypothetical protein